MSEQKKRRKVRVVRRPRSTLAPKFSHESEPVVTPLEPYINEQGYLRYRPRKVVA